MALPVTIPNEFASATASIPLSQLDTNFTTLADAVNGISDGSETLANASVTVLTAGTANVTTLNTSGQVVFNDAGADVDFRVEGDTDANLLFVDASTDRVGVGTNAPDRKLDVTGTGRITGEMLFGNDVHLTADAFVYSSNGGGGVRAGLFLDGTNQVVSIRTAAQVKTTVRPQFAVSYDGTTGLYLEDATNSAWKSWKLSTSFGAGSDLSFVQSTNTSGTPTWAAAAAMTLDASGNLLVETTNAATNAGIGFKFLSRSTDPSASVVGSETTDSSSCWSLYSTGASAFRFYVGYGGTVFATNTSISAISDQRLKENIRDLDVGLAEIMQLQPRVFDWKEGKGKNTQNDRGFIAQEFEQVFPDLIDEWKDPAPEGEEPYKSLRQDLIPVLVKAIQELKAELDEAKARIAALETGV